MDTNLVDLNKKLDALTAQVAYLTEQAQIAERQRQERSELIQDMMPAVNGIYSLTVEQLDEVKEYVDPDDLLRLLKTAAAQCSGDRTDARSVGKPL